MWSVLAKFRYVSQKLKFGYWVFFLLMRKNINSEKKMKIVYLNLHNSTS